MTAAARCELSDVEATGMGMQDIGEKNERRRKDKVQRVGGIQSYYGHARGHVSCVRPGGLPAFSYILLPS